MVMVGHSVMTGNRPNGGPGQTGWFANDPDGFGFGPQPYSYWTERRRHSLNSSYTQFFRLAGEHQLKVLVFNLSS